jgi:hypothetical protein
MRTVDVKDPSSIAPATYAWVFLLSLWGGLARHLQRRKSGEATRAFWLEFSCDLIYSSFCGLLTFFLCEAAKIDPMQTASMVGIAGHMGSRLIHALEFAITRRFLRQDV